jgi:hypothetical protein
MKILWVVALLVLMTTALWGCTTVLEGNNNEFTEKSTICLIAIGVCDAEVSEDVKGIGNETDTDLGLDSSVGPPSKKRGAKPSIPPNSTLND